MRKKLERHYSGRASERFWERINAADDYGDLYTLGLVLQSTESRVLAELEAREPPMSARKGKTG